MGPVGDREFFAVFSEKAGNYPKDITREISEMFSRYGLTVNFCPFYDKQQLVKDIAGAQNKGYHSFLAIGGDGTVSLLASNLLGKSHRLGIIPVGTTNTLARVLGIPLTAKEAIELVCSSDHIRPIDGLKVDSRIFFLNVSVGLTSVSLNNVDAKKKARFGILAYAMGIVSNLKRMPRRNYQMQIDGNYYHTRAIELHVTNTGILGTPRFHIYPDSRIDDGKAEILTLRRWTIGELLNAALDILTRRERQAFRLISTGTDIEIKCNTPIPVQADGDVVQNTPVRIRVMHKAINFIVP